MLLSSTRSSKHSTTEYLFLLSDKHNSIDIVYLVCGNKMPTRCNRGFYCRSYCLLNMFRAPLCPSSGAQGYYTVVAACGISCCGFTSCWSGVELRVMCPVCRMLQHPGNRTHKRLYSLLIYWLNFCVYVRWMPALKEWIWWHLPN